MERSLPTLDPGNSRSRQDKARSSTSGRKHSSHASANPLQWSSTSSRSSINTTIDNLSGSSTFIDELVRKGVDSLVISESIEYTRSLTRQDPNGAASPTPYAPQRNQKQKERQQQWTVSPPPPHLDITLRSSDGKTFTIARAQLEAHSAAFLGAHDFASSHLTAETPVLDVSESAAVLELLLQHMRAEAFPDLRQVEFKLLAELAEASEKYEAFAAMALCTIHMRNALQQHPFEVLQYAVKHGKTDIANLAAPHTLMKSHKIAMKYLSPGTALAWFQYNAAWKGCLENAIKSLPQDCNHVSGNGWGLDTEACANWKNSYHLLIQALIRGPNSTQRVKDVFEEAQRQLIELNGCQAKKLLKRKCEGLVQELEAVSQFSTLV